MVNRGSFYRCVECDEIITNPICSDCLAQPMKVFVQEFDRKLARKISGFALPGDTTCIKCRAAMGLCAHCFSVDVYQQLLEKNPMIAKEFQNRFDFDLRRTLVDFV